VFSPCSFHLRSGNLGLYLRMSHCEKRGLSGENAFRSTKGYRIYIHHPRITHNNTEPLPKTRRSGITKSRVLEAQQHSAIPTSRVRKIEMRPPACPTSSLVLRTNTYCIISHSIFPSRSTIHTCGISATFVTAEQRCLFNKCWYWLSTVMDRAHAADARG
jgi:hypothetical protein